MTRAHQGAAAGRTISDRCACTSPAVRHTRRAEARSWVDLTDSHRLCWPAGSAGPCPLRGRALTGLSLGGARSGRSVPTAELVLGLVQGLRVVGELASDAVPASLGASGPAPMARTFRVMRSGSLLLAAGGRPARPGLRVDGPGVLLPECNGDPVVVQAG